MIGPNANVRHRIKKLKSSQKRRSEFQTGQKDPQLFNKNISFFVLPAYDYQLINPTNTFQSYKLHSFPSNEQIHSSKKKALKQEGIRMLWLLLKTQVANIESAS